MYCFRLVVTSRSVICVGYTRVLSMAYLSYGVELRRSTATPCGNSWLIAKDHASCFDPRADWPLGRAEGGLLADLRFHK